ncbi:8924_t:CDS:2 [Funneliformis mosseae]|uniref:8924_t:CDS:1 n=1 Tax=Funneliformis mosseae TaxID=27381 RepID=A0A9N9GYH1_FUNMO|nr:8924_t:CDS:2 [Funneliformis mosseae]
MFRIESEVNPIAVEGIMEYRSPPSHIKENSSAAQKNKIITYTHQLHRQIR